MKYDCIVFDADHTLIDFDADERRAFRAAFEAAGVFATADMVEDCWAFSARNWAELGLLGVHMPSIQERYHALYADHVRAIVEYMGTVFALKERTEGAGRVFSEALRRPSHLVEGAEEVLDALGGRFRLCVATNGLADMQRGRLSAIAPRFERIFISEEMGRIKPHPDFFGRMCKELGVGAERCLMVGDSLESDVKGAVGAGMDAVWFNRRGETAPDGLPLREIAELPQLLKLL